MMRFVTTTVSVLVLGCSPVVSGEGFLKQDPRHVRLLADRQVELREAMASVKGCGSNSDAAAKRFPVVQRVLTPMWTVLPKNEQGRVEWRMLRYIAHRYFMQQSSLLIRGLEPSRAVNNSHVGAGDILSKHMPSLVDIVLDGRRSSLGFTLEDAVAVVVTMEQLIFDSESSLLTTAYKQQHRVAGERLNHRELSKVIESYMLHWIIGDDQESLSIVLNDRKLLEESIPHWKGISSFALGMVKNMEFSRQHAPPQPGHGLLAMTQTYSFEDAHEAVGAITKTFASYWRTECQTIKSSLVAMDKTGSGRISLSEFYGANADGQWRFGESEAYLRELGALDETSGFGGKYLIIPNYIQGASNCIISNSNYYVCCANECEDIMHDIEASIGAPVAHPQDILGPLANVTNFDDEAPKLTGTLSKQLQQIADSNGGKVPLHGRLFAQWLHYVFPRECPFPHKVGSIKTRTPAEYGDDFVVSDEVINQHAASRRSTTLQEQMIEQDEAQMMSQWSEEEEELIVDYSLHLTAPWDRSRRMLLVALVVLALALAGSGGMAERLGKSAGTTGCDSYNSKAHFV